MAIQVVYHVNHSIPIHVSKLNQWDLVSWALLSTGPWDLISLHQAVFLVAFDNLLYIDFIVVALIISILLSQKYVGHAVAIEI
jgi:hypothetical protein